SFSRALHRSTSKPTYSLVLGSLKMYGAPPSASAPQRSFSSGLFQGAQTRRIPTPARAATLTSNPRCFNSCPSFQHKALESIERRTNVSVKQDDHRPDAGHLPQQAAAHRREAREGGHDSRGHHQPVGTQRQHSHAPPQPEHADNHREDA